MTKILLVEDDIEIVKSLGAFLKSEGYQVDTVDSQDQAIDIIGKTKYDLLLIDISLRQGNGFAVCKAARSLYDIPVIFLTASNDEYSVITGLDMGADDFVNKPFRPRELLSRIKSVMRRSYGQGTTVKIGSLSIDTQRAVVEKNGSELFLSALEYRLLLAFINNRGLVLSRDKLMEEIWSISGEFVNDNTLTVYIKRLRDKMEDDPQNPNIIKTVRGLGYRLE